MGPPCRSPHQLPVSSSHLPSGGVPGLPSHASGGGVPTHPTYSDKFGHSTLADYNGGHANSGGVSNGGQQFEGSGLVADRNHNQLCGRPGCGRPVNKAADGTESTYCSSECVVGQCREVYSSWAGGANGAQPSPAPQVK